MPLELAISSSLLITHLLRNWEMPDKSTWAHPLPPSGKGWLHSGVGVREKDVEPKELAQRTPLFQHLAVSSNITPGDLYMLEVPTQ